MTARSDQPSRAAIERPLIRRAVAGDLPALEALLREIMADHGVSPPDAADLGVALATVLADGDASDAVGASPGPVDGRPPPPAADRDHLFLVAESQGRVVGMCALLFSVSTWSASRVCELQDVVVGASHRGQGVGRSLLEAAVATARSEGCTRVFLTAEAVNLPAHAFYRSLGFLEKTLLYFEQAT